MSSAQVKKVLIMAGGTGGHVFPALAVADVFRARGIEVDWLGTPRGIENTLVPAAKINLHHILVEGVRGKGVVGLLKALFLICLAFLQARRILKKVKPQVVLGFGGFASGPGGLAAKSLSIPLVIHEQNAVAGTTNRLLSKVAKQVLSAFAGAFENAQVVGNPVRSSIADLPNVELRYGERAEKKLPINVLVIGGSLGAKAINELMPDTFGKLAECFAADQQLNIWHQTGKNHLEATIANYMQHQVKAKVDAFIDDMANAYAWADLVICRAGALTVSELMVAGVASVLIPLPTAIDDHQSHNAAILVNAKAGFAFQQHGLTAEILAMHLTQVLHDAQHEQRKNLIAMAKQARSLALPQSAETVADFCMEVAGA